MTELIPLKKEIIFKTKIGEVTNIDVEHDYKINDDSVNGRIILSGTYKMTEASLIEEEYYYEIPFSIGIGEDIIKESINIEISDFKYEIEKDIMRIDAELEFICKKEEKVQKNIYDGFGELSDLLEENNDEDFEKEFKENTNSLIVDGSKNLIINEEKNEIQSNVTLDNITNNFINNDEKYDIYKVYIVREGDTIDTICTKFNIKHNELKEYNNLTEINIGDKIIIPSFDE